MIWEVVGPIFKRMIRKKLLIVREIGPFNRIYGTVDAFILCAGSLIGYQCYSFSAHMEKYGDGGLYSFVICGIFLSPNIWSFAELLSVLPCLGGTFHFTYCFTNEFIAFMTGWFTILSTGFVGLTLGQMCGLSLLVCLSEAFWYVTIIYSATNHLGTLTRRLTPINNFLICSQVDPLLIILKPGAAAQLKAAGSIMDDTFFSGHMANTMKDYMSLGEKHFLLDSAPDFLALFLSLIFSGIVSANTSETKLLNSALYFINQCCLICLTILFIGYIDFNNWVPFKLNHLIVLTNSFLSTSVIYSTILSLVFLGEEAINPSKTLPKAHILSFIFGLILFSVFPILITLVWNYREIESSNSIQSILIYLKLNGLTFIPLIGVTCFVYNSLFIDMFSLTRVVCAMSRDGLLYRVLSRVEHFNNMPVKPSFICGIVAGIVAMFGRQTTLREIEAISFLMISAMAPVCTLRMRYAHNIEHFKGKVSSPHGKPSPTCDVVVLVLKVSVVGVAVTTRHILSDFVTIYWISWKILPLFLFSVSMLISMTFLIFQPTNVTHSPYRVRLVPFVPMLDIFIHYFAIGNIEAKFLYFIILWALFGLFFYFTYSIWHSKEEI